MIFSRGDFYVLINGGKVAEPLYVGGWVSHRNAATPPRRPEDPSVFTYIIFKAPGSLY